MNKKILVVMVVLLCTAVSCGSKKTEKFSNEFQPNAETPRADIPDAFKWDTSVLFKTDADWKKAVENAKTDIEKLQVFKETLTSPEKIKECLDFYFPLHKRISWITKYTNLKTAVDQVNAEYNSMNNEALNLMSEIMERAGFIREEILRSDVNLVRGTYEGALAPYKNYLENLLRRQSRLLSKGEENVLAMTGDNLWAEIDLNEIPSGYEKAFQGMLADIKLPKIKDEKGNDVQLALSNYGIFRQSPDRSVRKSAVENFFQTLTDYQHLFGATLSEQVKLNFFFARARGYKRAIDAYLDKEDVDVSVYDNLITTTHNNLDKLHKYVSLRKKLMGLDGVHLYDLYVPLVTGVSENIPFEQGKEVILESLKPLGNNYLDELKKGLEAGSGWFDLYPNKDKVSGAFAAVAYGEHPFVKMNYYNDFTSVSTLAHEFGHAMNYYFANNAQPYWSANPQTFIAEIPSTFNEILLSNYMTVNAKTKEEKLYYLNDLLETIRGTIYRQTLFAEFEKKIHGFVEDGAPLTADLMNKTYADLVKQYYGPDYVLDKNDGIEWAYIPHFYYKFYVYNYATSLSAALALSKKVETGEPAAIKSYMELLKRGGSLPPIQSLNKAGVDMSTPDPIQAAYDIFGDTLDEFEKLITTN